MDKKKQVLSARSKENGIVFQSNKVPALCYEAYIDEEGEVKTRVVSTMVSNIRDFEVFISDDQNKNRKVELFSKITIFILAILSIIITKQVSIAIGLFYFSMIVLKDAIKFGKSSFELKLGKFKSTGRFHSAEHMVINAYEKWQRIPTMTELKKASRFDKDCSSRRPINKVVIFGLLTVVISLNGFIKFYMYIILAILLFIFSIFQQKYNILRFLQVSVTNKPTDKELKVALAGIEFFDEMEAQVPEGCCPMGAIIMEINIFDDDDEDGSAEN